jgi:hypothetical protein
LFDESLQIIDEMECDKDTDGDAENDLLVSDNDDDDEEDEEFELGEDHAKDPADDVATKDAAADDVANALDKNDNNDKTPALDATHRNVHNSSDSGFNPRYKEYYTYKDKEHARDSLCRGRIVSAVKLADGSFNMIIKGTKLLPIQPELATITRCGAQYYQWGFVNDNDPVPMTHLENGMKVDRYCLLLPELVRTGFQLPSKFNLNYYLITSDWCEMIKNFVIARPRMRGATYN